MGGWIEVVVLAAAVGSGIMAGIFFSFSTFVLQALRRLPPAHGIAAMQSINTTITTPLFLLAFLGTAAASAALVLAAVAHLDEPGAREVLVGGLCYLVGCLGVTVGYHLPRNAELDRLDPEAPTSAARWESFVPAWLRGNHVRTVASIAALAAFLASLR